MSFQRVGIPHVSGISALKPGDGRWQSDVAGRPSPCHPGVRHPAAGLRIFCGFPGRPDASRPVRREFNRRHGCLVGLLSRCDPPAQPRMQDDSRRKKEENCGGRALIAADRDPGPMRAVLDRCRRCGDEKGPVWVRVARPPFLPSFGGDRAGAAAIRGTRGRVVQRARRPRGIAFRSLSARGAPVVDTEAESLGEAHGAGAMAPRRVDPDQARPSISPRFCTAAPEAPLPRLSRRPTSTA